MTTTAPDPTIQAPPAMRVRSFEFRADAQPVGDGRTLEGYGAVFDQIERIRGWFEDWDEQIARGAFADSIKAKTPVMQFDHGHDPRTGTVPIASIEDLHEDAKGLFVRARLFDNPVVEPVREAIAQGAISGMSIRFEVTHEEVQQRKDDVDLRTIRAVDLHELGPVVFPAYDTTSVGVRSLLAGMDADEHRALLTELAAELGLTLPDLTGRPAARSAGGGEPRRDAAPTDSARARDRALRLKGIVHA